MFGAAKCWESDLSYNHHQHLKTSDPHSDALAHTYVNLQRYLGDVSFTILARAFFGARPTQKALSHVYFNALPHFLKSYRPFLRAPEIQELAALETALHGAFEAPDVSALTLNDIQKLNLDRKLTFHPSAKCLRFFQNTTSLWSALICEQLPPKPHKLDHVQYVIVWRQGTGGRFRIVGDEEALAFKSSSATEALPYLRNWVEAELVLPPERTGDILEK